jgi:bifunctional N-acetylglucosamine-1-phosphate-uridyltransferase/glucosamine-1-phosphate-acetyltransferase GlmU-like protein
MKRRVLVVPAAGTGSRLGAARPKVLVEVAGRPMVDHLRDLYAPHVDGVVLVVAPGALAMVREHVAGWPLPVRLVVQDQPTGMLDAILLGARAVLPFAEMVWITWCDQVGVHPATIERLAAESTAPAGSALVLPTVVRPDPYIHLARRPDGTIEAVQQRREGDEMPPAGESDMGLFAVSARAVEQLPAFAAEVVPGHGTGERNFLPFIPWLAARGEPVVTFPARDALEAVGVNTPEDRQEVERYLESRTGDPA